MVLGSNRHADDIHQKYAIDLPVLAGHDYLTILNCHTSNSTHRSIDKRAVIGFDHEPWSNLRLGFRFRLRLLDCRNRRW